MNKKLQDPFAFRNFWRIRIAKIYQFYMQFLKEKKTGLMQNFITHSRIKVQMHRDILLGHRQY